MKYTQHQISMKSVTMLDEKNHSLKLCMLMKSNGNVSLDLDRNRNWIIILMRNKTTPVGIKTEETI